jgi:hypothetical protein
VFTVIHSVTFLLPYALGYLPLASRLGPLWFTAVFSTWSPFVGWVSLHVPGISAFASAGGAVSALSRQLVGVLVSAVAAAIGAMLWGRLDRRRTEYRTLHEGLRIYLRFVLAVVLIGYGMHKVMLSQFDYPPSPNLLMTPLGELNPAWLLVSFNAASPLYQVFAGGVEVLAGALVMIRRTTWVGAFLAVAALVNVVLLNLAFRFGANVLVLAGSLLFGAVVLCLPALPSLAAMLLSARPAGPLETTELFKSPVAIRRARAISLLVLLATVGNQMKVNLSEGVYWRGRPPLYGAYEVVTFAVGSERAAIAPGPDERWVWLTIDPLPSGNRMAADALGTIAIAGRRTRFSVRVDTAGRLLELMPFGDPKGKSQWKYSLPDPDHLALARFDAQRQDSIHITLERRDPRGFPLLARQWGLN